MNGTAIAEFAQASIINPIRGMLDRKTIPHDAEDLWVLLQRCRYGTELVEGSWERVQDKLRGVTEGRTLARIVRQYVAVADGVLSVLSEFLDIANEDEDLSQDEKQSAIKQLDSFRQRVQNALGQLGSLLTWLERPPPQIDLSSIDRPGNVPKAEGYTNLDDILTKLVAGEDV